MTSVSAPFFIVPSSVTNLREQIKRAHKVFDKYYVSNLILSLGPEISRTEVFKEKVSLPGDERFWPVFSRTTDYATPSEHFIRLHELI